MPLVQRPGDLIEGASDAPVFGGQLPDGGQQLVIDRGTVTTGRMLAPRMALRINSDWLIP